MKFCTLHGQLLLAMAMIFVAAFGQAAQATPPRIVEISQAPVGSSGLWVVDQSGLQEVLLSFDQEVIVPDGD